MVQQISDNEIYLLIKYIKSVLWRVAKHLSYSEDARCLNVKGSLLRNEISGDLYVTQDTDNGLICLFSLYYKLWINILEEPFTKYKNF